MNAVVLVHLALGAGSASAEPPTDSPVGSAADPFEVHPTEVTLDNGLRVLLLPDLRTDTVALHLTFGVGSRDEASDEHGCAHLFEHLMFEGSAHVPRDQFDTWLSAGGGENNAFTDVDQTAYVMTFPSGALDLALFLESDRLGFLDAGLDPENLANQQQIVLQERAEGYAEPNGRDTDVLMRLLFPPDHPYHHPTIGTVAAIEGFDLDGVRAFWERHYRPNNAALVLVGRFDTDHALDPDGPEAERFVLDYLVDVTLHEVGHTLGLRHNFRSSRVYTRAQMNDPDFVQANGLAGSVMEYAPINLAEPGKPALPGFQKTIGPYDHWAVEYAYRPMPPGSTRQQEAAELQRIAGRSAEPQLAYGTDEDNSLGIDPESLVFDLGDDPIGFANQRIAIARDLLQRQATRELKPGTDYSVLRRSVNYAIREMGRAGGVMARQIGGVRTLRDFPGSGRDPLVPVDAALQRAALDALSRHYMSADAVVLSPALQRRLAPDYAERTDALFAGESGLATDFSLASMLLEMQRALLAQLMSDGVAQRILDGEGKSEPGQAFRLSELYERLGRDLWSELDARAGDIAAPRRELQREHASRLAAVLVRPSGQGRADMRSLLRQQAQALVTRIDAAQRRAGLGAEARAHLADVAEVLRQGLSARVNRPA